MVVQIVVSAPSSSDFEYDHFALFSDRLRDHLDRLRAEVLIDQRGLPSCETTMIDPNFGPREGAEIRIDQSGLAARLKKKGKVSILIE